MYFHNPFKKTHCEICGRDYDAFASSCPECGNKNDPKSEITPLDDDKIAGPIRELLCFLVGWLSLKLIATIVIIFAELMGMDNATAEYSAFVNFVSYGILFVALLSIVFPKLKTLLSNFLSKNTLKGFLVFIAIIVFDVAWGLFIQGLGATTNQNQSTINGIVKVAPIASVIFLGFVGPLCEEITYRVGLFTFLKRINVVLAYVAVAIFFGAIHMHDFTSVNEWLSLPPYVFAGFAFTFAYDKWGLGSSIVAHCAVNLLAIL